MKVVATRWNGLPAIFQLTRVQHRRPGYFSGYYSLGVNLRGTDFWIHLWHHDGSDMLWRCLAMHGNDVLADATGNTATNAVANAERDARASAPKLFATAEPTREQRLVSAFES